MTGGAWPDVAHDDIAGDPRAACAFDTPALRGLWDSAPYLHDGRAATLEELVEKNHDRMGHTDHLEPADRAALVAFLRTL